MDRGVSLPPPPWEVAQGPAGPFADVRAMRMKGTAKADAAKAMGMSRASFDRMLRRAGLFGGWQDKRRHNGKGQARDSRGLFIGGKHD